METKDVLKDLRKRKGFSTMQDFCNAANINFSTYQNYESGKRLPTAEILMQIADFYGVTTDYLLGREPPTDPFKMLGLDTSSKNVVEEFAGLPDDSRKFILDIVIKLADAARGISSNEEHPPLTLTKTLGQLEDETKARRREIRVTIRE